MADEVSTASKNLCAECGQPLSSHLVPVKKLDKKYKQKPRCHGVVDALLLDSSSEAMQRDARSLFGSRISPEHSILRPNGRVIINGFN